jgi:hypothetical protein
LRDHPAFHFTRPKMHPHHPFPNLIFQRHLSPHPPASLSSLAITNQIPMTAAARMRKLMTKRTALPRARQLFPMTAPQTLMRK